MTHRITREQALACTCAFCSTGREHREHGALQSWTDLGSRLLVADSLRNEDRVPVQACGLCGHLRERKG